MPRCNNAKLHTKIEVFHEITHLCETKMVKTEKVANSQKFGIMFKWAIY